MKGIFQESPARGPLSCQYETVRQKPISRSSGALGTRVSLMTLAASRAKWSEAKLSSLGLATYMAGETYSDHK